jgi:hypothetical protein
MNKKEGEGKSEKRERVEEGDNRGKRHQKVLYVVLTLFI